MRNLLAFDLGASNGRAILGQFDGEPITMRELHRFENNYIEMNGVFYWDLPYLYNQLKAYHAGKRAHKEMKVMSRHMTEEDMEAIASYYAGLPPR